MRSAPDGFIERCDREKLDFTLPSRPLTIETHFHFRAGAATGPTELHIVPRVEFQRPRRFHVHNQPALRRLQFGAHFPEGLTVRDA